MLIFEVAPWPSYWRSEATHASFVVCVHPPPPSNHHNQYNLCAFEFFRENNWKFATNCQYIIPVLEREDVLPNSTISVTAGSKDSPLTARATWRNVRNVFGLNFSLLTVNVELEKDKWDNVTNQKNRILRQKRKAYLHTLLCPFVFIECARA